ncbi:MAG: hypothetical protein IKP62_10800, partial [Salinivirgaceae bacterium]|nr:hypothetical protein [Salinivirgaceae bacterium]
SFLPLFCAHNVIELSASALSVFLSETGCKCNAFSVSSKNFFNLFFKRPASASLTHSLSPLSRSASQPSLELAPFRKAGAKVEGFSFHAREK